MVAIRELTDENFETMLKNEPLAIVDFYASWCGQCRMAAPMFKKVAEDFGLPIFKIDIEKNPHIKSLVHLDGLPTIGLFKNVEPHEAINTTKEEALREFLQQHGVVA